MNVEFNFDVNIRNGDRNGDNRNQNNGNDVNENGQGGSANGDRNNRCNMEIDIEPRRPKGFIVISAPRNNDRDSLYAPSSSRSGNGVHGESSDDEHDKKRDKNDKKRDKSADDQKPGPSGDKSVNDNRNQKKDNGNQNNGNDKNNENERDGNGNGERNNECIVQIDIDNPRRSNEVIVISGSRSNDRQDPQESGHRFVFRNDVNSGPERVSETGNGVYSDSSDDEQCLCNKDSYENDKKRDKKGDKSVDDQKPGPSGDKSVNNSASTSRIAANDGEKKEKYVMFRKNRDPVYMNFSPDNNERRDPLPPVQYQIEQRHHVLYIGVGAQQNTYRFPRDASEVLQHLNLSSHVDASGLVTDFAMRRFGRADGEDVNIIHIGPEGPMVNGVQTRSRPDRSSLRFLSVTGYRNITDRSLVHLATAAPNLTFIDFSGTNVTESGAENFRSLRPDCDVVYSPFHEHDEEKREP